MSEQGSARGLLAALFAEGLQAVHGRECVARHLQARPAAGRTAIIAIGKAAGAMLSGALEVLQDALSSALLITPQGEAASCPVADSRIRHVPGNHPVPGAESVAAGTALCEFLAALPTRQALLVLISGGSSSLVEVPQPGIDLAELQAVNRWLLASGLDIVQMNQVRSALSQIKGGRLQAHVGQRAVQVLLLSDVPGDDPAIIGSGLLQPAAPAALPELPDWLQALVERVPATPGPARHIEHCIVANNRAALDAVVRAARRQGWPAMRMDTPLSGDVPALADRLVQQLQAVAPGMYVWGGESTVRLPVHPGEGGRNQQLALAMATRLTAGSPVVLLAAGTDGRDGNSDAAGAIIDAQTVARGEQAGLDAADCLRRADAGSFLRASGDRLVTGPTGTNVMDIVIAAKFAESSTDAGSV
jgi:hydroxypyruvate reductase